jgi:hypothetical protein
MKDDEKKAHIKQVARRFKVICNEQIEEIEDRLPKITNPLEKDKLLKEIDALLSIAFVYSRRWVDRNKHTEDIIKCKWGKDG